MTEACGGSVKISAEGANDAVGDQVGGEQESLGGLGENDIDFESRRWVQSKWGETEGEGKREDRERLNNRRLDIRYRQDGEGSAERGTNDFTNIKRPSTAQEVYQGTGYSFYHQPSGGPRE